MAAIAVDDRTRPQNGHAKRRRSRRRATQGRRGASLRRLRRRNADRFARPRRTRRAPSPPGAPGQGPSAMQAVRGGVAHWATRAPRWPARRQVSAPPLGPWVRAASHYRTVVRIRLSSGGGYPIVLPAFLPPGVAGKSMWESPLWRSRRRGPEGETCVLGTHVTGDAATGRTARARGAPPGRCGHPSKLGCSGGFRGLVHRRRDERRSDTRVRSGQPLARRASLVIRATFCVGTVIHEGRESWQQ